MLAFPHGANESLRSELKYFKADAAAQLAKYAADRDLARAWHLAQGTKHKAQGTVCLTRHAIVFHITELALCEEL